MSLDRRVALVTGASRGIDAAIAYRLAQAGTDVAVGYGHDAEAAGMVAAGISELGRRSVAVGGNVADPSELDQMVSAAEETGPIDVLVSNVGISPTQELEEITVEDWGYGLWA
jgi:3-oxoacyl-[acyl-carrier protein] reductase